MKHHILSKQLWVKRQVWQKHNAKNPVMNLYDLSLLTATKSKCRTLQTRFPTSFNMTWRDIAWIITSVGYNVFSVFYLSFSYDQAQLSPNMPNYCFRRILQEFEWFRKGFEWKHVVVCLKSICRGNKCTFSNWCLFHVFFFFILPGTWCNVCFIINTCFNYRWKLNYSPYVRILRQNYKMLCWQKAI